MMSESSPTDSRVEQPRLRRGRSLRRPLARSKSDALLEELLSSSAVLAGRSGKPSPAAFFNTGFGRDHRLRWRLSDDQAPDTIVDLIRGSLRDIAGFSQARRQFHRFVWAMRLLRTFFREAAEFRKQQKAYLLQLWREYEQTLRAGKFAELGRDLRLHNDLKAKHTLKEFVKMVVPESVKEATVRELFLTRRRQFARRLRAHRVLTSELLQKHTKLATHVEKLVLATSLNPILLLSASTTEGFTTVGDEITELAKQRDAVAEQLAEARKSEPRFVCRPSYEAFLAACRKLDFSRTSSFRSGGDSEENLAPNRSLAHSLWGFLKDGVRTPPASTSEKDKPEPLPGEPSVLSPAEGETAEKSSAEAEETSADHLRYSRTPSTEHSAPRLPQQPRNRQQLPQTRAPVLSSPLRLSEVHAGSEERR
eukprot:RCo047021